MTVRERKTAKAKIEKRNEECEQRKRKKKKKKKTHIPNSSRKDVKLNHRKLICRHRENFVGTSRSWLLVPIILCEKWTRKSGEWRSRRGVFFSMLCILVLKRVVTLL